MAASLPPRLIELLEKSMRLQARILHLDRLIYQPAEKRTRHVSSPRAIELQLNLLRAAFEAQD